MTRHAKVDARNSSTRSGLHSAVTLGALDSDFVHVMNFVWEVDRLLRLGFDAKEMLGGVRKRGVRCREYR